ncbi:MAG: LPS translocon maturation chaperone LptM [Usitatibacter sp.]
MIRALLVAAALAALCACGQKGPLRLPDSAPPAKPAPGAP